MTDKRDERRTLIQAGSAFIQDSQLQRLAKPEPMPELIVLEAFATALMMKPAHQRGALCVARYIAAQLGFDPDAGEAFVVEQIQERAKGADL